METTSYDGGLLMNLYYPMNYNMDKAERDIRMALAEADLSTNVNAPAVTRITTSTFPVLSYSLTTNNEQVDDDTLRSTVQTGRGSVIRRRQGGTKRGNGVEARSSGRFILIDVWLLIRSPGGRRI
ncbi:hypothetical protein [Paenibacillus pabuli]|uniref:hypothetical protein n=1 Tax=Paenibacillus pabuli TaxID=1472 RepID=UPI001FFF534B|nr:hypothetical protein [Paenibacillus pabuli]